MAVSTLAGSDDDGWEASVYHDLSHGCVLRMRNGQENRPCCERGDRRAGVLYVAKSLGGLKRGVLVARLE